MKQRIVILEPEPGRFEALPLQPDEQLPENTLTEIEFDTQNRKHMRELRDLCNHDGFGAALRAFLPRNVGTLPENTVSLALFRR